MRLPLLLKAIFSLHFQPLLAAAEGFSQLKMYFSCHARAGYFSQLSIALASPASSLLLSSD